MLPHLLKVFFRTSVRNSGYSFINISGLTVGLGCAILIFLWISDERSFDDFHQDRDRIFQVMANHAFDDNMATYPDTPGPLAEALRELSGVEQSIHTTFNGRALFHYGDKSIYEDGIYADADIFQMFNFPIVQGNARNPFPDNNSIAISQSLARKYFKTENALGKVFRIDNRLDMEVTSVFKDIPYNSSLRFDYVMPYPVYAKTDPYNQEWGAWTGGATYVKLRNAADRDVVTEKIASSFTEPKIWVRWDDNVELFLFPLADWHLHNHFENGVQTGGRIAHVRIFIIVAIFILFIACINFMNLATARSMSRSREIGMRKIVGAGRRSLVAQFMLESILLCLICLVAALLIVHLLLPSFNDLTGKHIRIDYTDSVISGSLIGIALLTGVMAGSYPALFLSSFKVIHVLKGRFSGLKGIGLRKTLVVFQFTLSVVLVICALVVYRQISFMRNKNLGFDKGNTFYFNSSEGIKKHFEAFRNEALQNPDIGYVSQSDANPIEIFSEIVLADDEWQGKTKDDDISFKWLKCDYDFLPALGFTFLKGRNFSRDIGSDSLNYIITAEAARRMNLPHPIGQRLKAPYEGEIIGVVNDFHSEGLQAPIGPVIIALRPEKTNRVFIRYETGHAEAAIHDAQAIYKRYEPNQPMEYAFMDETFDRQYRNEIMIGALSKYFTAIAIFISCLGLFGLASFAAERRTKEIGVRKVMGASVWQIVILFCRDFALLIIAALMVGIPLGWWGMHKFLDGYAFHTDVGVPVVVITALGMIVVALLTVSFQSVRAALADPVKSLRTE
ncbi:MAG TPA: ABC transporter permease [Chryseosolibacter sp.]|nr:ABC transporter permease [Chryseosolibacter sp.]